MTLQIVLVIIPYQISGTTVQNFGVNLEMPMQRDLDPQGLLLNNQLRPLFE